MDNAGPDGDIFVGCCNFTEAKSREVCTVLLDKGLFLKNRTALPKNRSVWSSNGLKTVDLDYRLTAHDRQFLQGNLFLLAVRTREVPLYLCSIFCSRSLVQVSTASYRVLSAEHAPNCIP